MKFLDWLRPGLKIKRWLFLGIIGIFLISYGIALFISNGLHNDGIIVQGIYLIIGGVVFLITSVIFLGKTLMGAINESGLHCQVDSKTLSAVLIEKRYLEKGPKIVAIGGGTGLSTMLRGLKIFTSNLTAVVTVSDDGGGSGILRDDLGILPPGDIRNCILALARTEPILEKLLQYRFKEGMLKGQNFGNLFLAAMTGISGSFEEAVKKMSDVLAVTGVVVPVTLDDIRLCAELEDKSIVYGESSIVKEAKEKNTRINRIYLEPSDAKALPDVINTIREADIIVMGPGSLYTSILPNLLVAGVRDAIRESSALKIFVCNIMTQKGETDNYTAYDHIRVVEEHIGTGCIDYCVVNKGRVEKLIKQKYDLDGAQKVTADAYKIIRNGIKVVTSDFTDIEKGYVRHNPIKLAATILNLANDEARRKEKRKLPEYFYVRERIKRMASG